ncbi:MAG: outer membrane protein transport protein [Phascolarctobacterium sp.]|nr:outer membrane protein transport protein [Phascolarctobacterium sp.]
MKKHLLALSAAAVLLVPQAVGAEGFAINEWTAEGMAMGGARMFAENDAGNMAYNPAAMTKIQGEKFKASVSYLSPHGKWDATSKETTLSDGTKLPEMNYSGRNRVNPGIVPGLYYVKQLNDKEWLGMATYTRFGMICQFERDSIVATNAFSSRLNGTSIAMNYARKHDSKWSTSIGAEINYVGLQYDKNLAYPHLGQGGPLHLEGTSWALGWNAAANYEFDDKNEFAVVYRSKVKHSMEAEYDAHGMATVLPGAAMGSAYPAFGSEGDVYGCVTLPESWMLGYGHRFNDKTRVELNATWTRWSRFDAFAMTFSPSGAGYSFTSPNSKNWEDGWRYAIGIEHKLSDKYSLMAGIAHDERSIPDETADFMVPTGERDTYTIGVQYHDKKQTVALALGYMDVGELNMTGHDTDSYKEAKMYDSYTKMVAISYQYNF